MKTYVLTVSRHFPAKHPKAGVSTFFPAKIMNGQGADNYVPQPEKKIHTIRANYDLWAKRAEEINAGRAVLSIRYWSDKPYRSNQVEFCVLNRIGVQKLTFSSQWFNSMLVDGEYCFADIETSIAKNDGLSFDDFAAWFKGYDLSKPMSIIHFTDFRY